MSEPERLNEIVQPLIPQIQAGDRGALEKLIRTCQQQVYRWALSKTADSDDADDVTQEVLVRLERTLPSYRGEARFTTWLYRLTGNVAIDLQRGRSRRMRLGEKEAVRQQSEAAAKAVTAKDRPLDAIHASNVARLVRAYFEKLPQQQREIFDLVDLQGCTPAEVSRMLDMNGATVRAHLFKARRTIRRRIIMDVPALQEELA